MDRHESIRADSRDS